VLSVIRYTVRHSLSDGNLKSRFCVHSVGVLIQASSIHHECRIYSALAHFYIQYCEMKCNKISCKPVTFFEVSNQSKKHDRKYKIKDLIKENMTVR